MTQHMSATGQSSGAGVQDKAQEALAQGKDAVQEKAQDIAAQGNDRLRQEVDRRSTDLGEQAGSLARALRRSAQDLESQGSAGGAASLAHTVADRIDSIGSYLRDADSDALLGNVEQMARKRPWVAGGVGLVLGFAASRFLKASSDRRYDAGRRDRELASRDADYPLTRERHETLVRPGIGGSEL